MGRIISFVAAGNTYNFAATLGDQDYRDNFKDTQVRFSRVAGADGGVDEYGSGRAPGAVGNIQVSMMLESATREGMQALRDDLAKIKEWGLGQLYFQPTDPAAVQRWCICRLDNIDAPEKRHKHTDLYQPVKLTFQTGEPYWLTVGNQNLWDSAYSWNSAINWDGAGFTTITGSGLLTATNNGNAYTVGRFVGRVTGATAFSQLIVRRLVNGAVIDEMILFLSLVQNDMIEFDPRKQWVLVNGIDQFANFIFRHPDWLRLLPGANSIEVITDQAAAQLDVAVRYFERYV